MRLAPPKRKQWLSVSNDCGLEVRFLTKGDQDILQNCLDPGRMQEMYKVSLEHPVTSESEEVIRDSSGQIRRTQEPTWRGSPWEDLHCGKNNF